MKPTVQTRRLGLILWSVVCSLRSVVPAFADTHYVNATNALPRPPYTNWVDAATVIQEAVDAAGSGDSILVADGSYSLKQPLVVTNSITVCSARDTEWPILTGGYPIRTNRCVYLSNSNAVLAHLRIEGGAAPQGGGVLISDGGTVRDSVIDGNFAAERGGGVQCKGGGLVDACTITGNGSLSGGGVDLAGGVVRRSTLIGNVATNDGGGVCCLTAGVVEDCVLRANEAKWGGGINLYYGGTARRCVLADNRAGANGGGVLCSSTGVVECCLILSNSAPRGGGISIYEGGNVCSCTVARNEATDAGGGLECDAGGVIVNSIVYANTRVGAVDNYFDTGLGCAWCFVCTTPLPPVGAGHQTNDPAFVGFSDYRLAPGSPCIDAGTNETWMATATDLRGCPRICGGRVDIGAYEWSGANLRIDNSRGASRVTSSSATLNGRLLSAAGLATTASIFWGPTNGRTDMGAWTNRIDLGVRAEGGFAGMATGLLKNAHYCYRSWASNEDATAWAPTTAEFMTTTASTHFVSLVSTNPAWPFASWATAATNIQEALEACTAESRTVVVTDGVYDVGGAFPTNATLFSRIVIDKPVTVRSVNGPATTAIVGEGPSGDAAVRCAWVGQGAVLAGFTLSNGHARVQMEPHESDYCGGGAYADGAMLSNCVVTACAAAEGAGVSGGYLVDCVFRGNSVPYPAEFDPVSRGAAGGGAKGASLLRCRIERNSAWNGGGLAACSATNCVLTGNVAGWEGGAADNCTLRNCSVSGNSAHWGGGCDYSRLYNCTVTRNTADYGGGVTGSCGYNSVVYWNAAVNGANHYQQSSFEASCTTPNPGGAGNLQGDPMLVSATHLSRASPCIGAGRTNLAAAIDLDGEAWATPPSMGCDEVVAGNVRGDLKVSIGAPYTSATTGANLEFWADIEGRADRSRWDFEDGTVVSNTVRALHAWTHAGIWPLTLTAYNDDHPEGVSATCTVSVVAEAVHYVSQNSTSPASPFASWATAATNVQDAIDACSTVGGTVLVSNGVYASGGAVTPGGELFNRIVVTNRIAVRSVNGPEVTALVGEGPLGDKAVRCAYVVNEATLAGFTLTNGHTRTGAELWGQWEEINGGGVYALVGYVSNCVLTCNEAACNGGGSDYGIITDCVFENNLAQGGGGADGSALYNCILRGNRAEANYGSGFPYTGGAGGASFYGSQVNCLVYGNSAVWGGGAYYGDLRSCTLVENEADDGGGGAFSSDLRNCIVYRNKASTEPDYSTEFGGSAVAYCCSPGLTNGLGNITNAPVFVDPDGGDFRLQAGSPGVDVGAVDAWMIGAKDLQGAPRIRNGVPDMGAYEFAFNLNVRALLQGAYAGDGLMRAAPAGSLPGASPYAADVREKSVMATGIVDWVLLEIRDTNATVRAERSLLLGFDGWICDHPPRAGFGLEASPGWYAITLKHRNHLSLQTSGPVAFTNINVTWDFSISPDVCLGGPNACVELEPGVWGMIGGDADGDGKITPTDRKIVEQQKGKTGYLSGDLNLDGKVDGED